MTEDYSKWFVTYWLVELDSEGTIINCLFFDTYEKAKEFQSMLSEPKGTAIMTMACKEIKRTDVR